MSEPLVRIDGMSTLAATLTRLGDELAEVVQAAFDDGALRLAGDDDVVAVLVSAGRLLRGAEAVLVDAVAQVRAADGSEAACSVGVAVFASRDVTFYNLLEVADRALYQSKNRGKGIYTVLEV